jgi:hypothetical protein
MRELLGHHETIGDQENQEAVNSTVSARKTEVLELFGERQLRNQQQTRQQSECAYQGCVLIIVVIETCSLGRRFAA